MIILEITRTLLSVTVILNFSFCKLNFAMKNLKHISMKIQFSYVYFPLKVPWLTKNAERISNDEIIPAHVYTIYKRHKDVYLYIYFFITSFFSFDSCFLIRSKRRLSMSLPRLSSSNLASSVNSWSGYSSSIIL